jgi:hydrogenase nickel incorporation protein HypB
LGEYRVIEVHEAVGAVNDAIADETRRMLSEKKVFFVNLMASPGAGKTSVLLKIAGLLKGKYKVGVMEADIEAEVDAERMERADIPTIEVHTAGRCAMDAKMTAEALKEYQYEGLDFIFLENIGNLVCPAEDDTGAMKNICILSYPEGDDKPLKYPLMFEVCDAVIINKTDTAEFFPFDREKAVKRIKDRNPASQIFFVSAKTGEGFEPLVKWLIEEKKREEN